MDPFQVLREAIRAVPAVKYALGVAGIAAVVAIVFGLKLRPDIAVFGALIVIGLMFVLVVFSSYAGQQQHPGFLAPAVVLVWFYTLLVIAATTLFVTSYFWHWPPVPFPPVPVSPVPFAGQSVSQTAGALPVSAGAKEPVQSAPSKPPVVKPQVKKPQTPCEQYDAAKNLDHKGNTEEARKEYEKALQGWDLASGCEKSYIYKDLAYLLLRQAKKDPRGAVENFLGALGAPIVDTKQPRNDDDVYRGLAAALGALGEPQGAIDAATTLADEPNNSCQHYELAKYLNHRGDLNNGDLQARIHEYRKALDNWPANDKDCTAKTNVIKDLGCAYATAQDSIKAHEYLSQQPDEQVTAYCLGKLHQ